MAQIIGGIGVSHTPTIGYAYDRALREDPSWRPVFDNFDVVRAWLDAAKPDVLFVIYNDHVTSFSFDHYSAFALGVDDAFVEPVDGPPTPVTFCEIFPPDSFPLYFYRGPKAPDLHIGVDDLDYDAIRAAEVSRCHPVTLRTRQPSGAVAASAAAISKA